MLTLSDDEEIAEGDKVMIRWTLTGTVQTASGPVPVHFTGIDIFRIEDGKLAELRQLLDQTGLDQQLAAAESRVTEAAAEGIATPMAATERPVEFVWEAKGGVEPLTFPQDATIAPDGNVWVGDLANHQFQIFSPDGANLESWGEEGSGPGQFSFFQGPLVVESDFAGNINVLDMGDQNIQKFASDRTFLHAFGHEGRAHWTSRWGWASTAKTTSTFPTMGQTKCWSSPRLASSSGSS
jgi:hypothetical protein